MIKEIKNVSSKKIIIALGCAVIVLYGALGYGFKVVLDMQKNLEQQQAEIIANRKVYVYDLEEVLRSVNAIEAKTKFEGEIIKLNDELFAAEKKIKSIKDAKVKADFSDVYLNNLKLKREELVSKYEATLKELTDKINLALGEIAAEKNASAIFVKSIIAANTSNVEDVTMEVIARIKQ